MRGIAIPALVSSLCLAAQDPASIWKTVLAPPFAPDRHAAVNNVTVVRDRLRLTLTHGLVQFAQPAGGLVFGAAFEGRGRVQIEPPDAIEAQQLRLFLRKDILDMEFTEAVLIFTDETFSELSAKLTFGPAASPRLSNLFKDRWQAGEDIGDELQPRLFKSLLSGDRKRTALFAADLKTDEKGWIHVRFDALQAEELTAGRWANWGPAIRLDQWLSFPAGNRTAAEVHAQPMAKHDFRIGAYRIEASVTEGAELRATTRVTFSQQAAAERVLLFELDSNLRVESVSDGSRPLAFFQPRDPKDRNQSYGDYVAVVLPEATRAGQQQTLEFRYAGKRVIRKVGAGNYFCQSYGWYPGQPDNFAARAGFEMQFRYPKKYTLVATGNKVEESTDGNLALSTWKSDLPLAVAGFAFGDYKTHTEKAGNIDVEVYANRTADDSMKEIQMLSTGVMPGETPTGIGSALGSLSPAALAKTMGIEMANTLKVFEAYFGPYPYKRLAVTNIPYSYGQGWPMLIYLSALSFLDSTQRHGLGVSGGGHVQLTDFFRAHESSHQWWGHRVGWKSYHDQWISEGFAQFSGNLYVRIRKGENEFVNRLRHDKEQLLKRDEKSRVYESLGPVWMGIRLASSDAPDAYANIVYNKGGFVLHMLRSMLFDTTARNPDARFMAMMRDFCQTFHNQPASTEDFKAIAEKHMIPAMDAEGNGHLDWFFRQYVYGTGVPEYEFKHTIQAAGPGKWKVIAVTIPRNVRPGWNDVLVLYMQSAGQTRRVGLVKGADRETPFELEMAIKPDKFSLNNNEDTLAVIRQ